MQDTKISKAERKTVPERFRAEPSLNKLIKTYAESKGISKSSALRELIITHPAIKPLLPNNLFMQER